MATILKPPAPQIVPAGARVVFLAGSIEMGAAEDWQSEVSAALHDVTDLVLLNPRRDDWDASWRQSREEPRFREQVEWELDGLERADVIAVYFAPSTRAPITLLELGLHARSGNAVVCCPEGFWRRGNVEIVCDRYGVPRVADLAELIAHLRRSLLARGADS